MRPGVLDNGYSVGVKLLFRLVRATTGRPLPDAARLTFYRSDFYGSYAKDITHHVMRGPSEWTVGDRELMAAYVSRINSAAFCVGAHSAVAAAAYQDEEVVARALYDVDSVPLADDLRGVLRMLGTLTREGTLQPEAMRGVLAAGASPQQIQDALAVGFVFNTTGRLANAFAFDVLDSEGFAAGAKYLLRRGYK